MQISSDDNSTYSEVQVLRSERSLCTFTPQAQEPQQCGLRVQEAQGTWRAHRPVFLQLTPPPLSTVVHGPYVSLGVSRRVFIFILYEG